MFWIFVFTSLVPAIFSTADLHVKRGGMKGKAERVSSVKVIKNHRREKARAEIRTRVGGSTVL
jgi:hypothetical protein